MCLANRCASKNPRFGVFVNFGAVKDGLLKVPSKRLGLAMKSVALGHFALAFGSFMKFHKFRFRGVCYIILIKVKVDL